MDAVGLVVSDMGRAVAFYSLLGFEFPEGSETEGHVEVTLAGGLRVLFDTIEVVQSFSAYMPPAGGHRMGLAFLCDDPAEVDTIHARLVAAGHRSHLEPFDAFWGQRYATVLDPDGNPVDLFAAL
jgi:uncharacterized glyoxalase superfamily protein PhnB